MAAATHFEFTYKEGVDGSNGRRGTFEGTGCLSFSAARVSEEKDDIFSEDESWRTAPRKLPSATWASTRRESDSSGSFGLVDGRRDWEISGPAEMLPEYQVDKLLLNLLVKDFCACPAVGSSERVLRTTNENVRRACQSAGELEAAQLARDINCFRIRFFWADHL